MIRFLYQLVMQNKRIAIYVANSTRLPYLDIRGWPYMHLSRFHARPLIRIHVHNNMRY